MIMMFLGGLYQVGAECLYFKNGVPPRHAFYEEPRKRELYCAR